MKSTFQLLFLFFALTTGLTAQNHSFAYAGPYCPVATTVSPSTSSNFVPGGNFIASPSGLVINGSTGVITLNTSAAGTYTVQYTGAICNCFTNAPVFATVTILPSPTISIIGSFSVCSGGSVTFTASGANTYQWTTGAQTSTMTDIPFSSTTYTVIGTDANGCTGTGTITATVVSNPSITIVASPTVCYAYNYQLLATSAAGTSYTWEPVPNSSSLSATASLSLSANTVFTVTAAKAGCTSTAVHAVQVVPIPSVSVAGTNTLCVGKRVTLTAFGATTYTWNNGTTLDTLGVQPVSTTVYSVIGTDFNGCKNTGTFQVIVYPMPTIQVISSSSVCQGYSLQMTATGASSYTWSTLETGASISFTAPFDTTVFVVGRTINGCSDTVRKSIRVFPTASVTVNSATACAASSVQLIATPTGTITDNVQYLWSSSGGTDATLTAFPLVTTTYTVRTVLGACTSTAVGTVSVTPATFPVVSFSYGGPFCTGGAPPSPTLAPNFSKGGIFYSTMGVNVDPATGLIDLSSLNSGAYSVQYSVEPKGCVLKGVGSTFIKVDKSVKITMDERIEVTRGQTVKLLNSGGVTSYSWSPAFGLDCAICETPVLTADKTQVYCVTSRQACSEGSCILVDVVCERTGDNSVPTAFTPNKDGLNDMYCLKGWDECIKSFNVKIFDRWGTMVYESEDPNFCWDGKFDGELLPAGVYVYSIRAIYSTLELVKKSGNITIIR